MDSFKKGFDNHNTYYERSLNINKIPNIFIHGVGLDNTMWYPQKKKFKDNHVIFYDILNHGKSKKGYSRLTFENFSNQLNNLLTHLKINKINLIGFSIGALIAQYFSLEHSNKVDKLILIGSVYKRSEKQIKIVRNRFKESKAGKSITEDSINRWFSKSYLKNNPHVYKFFFNLLENKKNKDFIPAYQAFVESDKNKLDFSDFNIPTLIMTGENEIGSTPKMSQDLNKDINDSMLYIIKDAKHGATIEKANDVNNQITKFLFV
jgi:pimeloyl-ACP methyl ester carboxylesterase